MKNDSILFLSLRQINTGRVLRDDLPMRYILACHFLHCGIVDRTRTLDQGFEYSVLDPMPRWYSNAFSFQDLCEARGAEIVGEAVDSERIIRVLWSGGIDSTAAFIAISKAAEKVNWTRRIQVLLSKESINEYPVFYDRYIQGKYPEIPVTPPIAECLDPACINVTGEHGDQLFGSLLLDPLVRAGIAEEPYEDVLPEIMIKQFANNIRAERLLSYLEPLIAAAPVPIRTLFDYLWWLNFSLKWQTVTLRLIALGNKPPLRLYRSLWHFFRTEPFQQWSFSFHPRRVPLTWERYKEVAKEYIRAYTGDEEYFLHKEKEPSLGRVMRRPDHASVMPALIRGDFTIVGR